MSVLEQFSAPGVWNPQAFGCAQGNAWNVEFGIWNLEPFDCTQGNAWNVECGIWNLEPFDCAQGSVWNPSAVLKLLAFSL